MDIAALALGLVFLLPAAFIDFRTREVPDMLSYGLLFCAIVVGVGSALSLWSFAPFLRMVFGSSAGAALGLLMFFTGQWGGADAKLLIGVGAVLGLGFGTLDTLLFMLLLFVGGAAWGILYALVLGFGHRKIVIATFKKQLHEPRIRRWRIFVVAGGFAFLLLIVFARGHRFALAIVGVCSYLLFYLWLLVKSIEESVLIKQYPLGKLTEGDWIWKDVVIRGKVLCGPKDHGISEEQIATLRRLKIGKVWVKEGIPFVPSFLLAFLLTFWLGSSLGQFLSFVFS